MDLPVVDEPLAPGLHVRRDPEPLAAAKQLAVDLDGDLCTTDQEARDLLSELAAFPPLGADEILRVRRLSERVTAARRVVERTVDRAAIDVGERLASLGAGVAVHPTAVRERAAAVLAARERLAVADGALGAAREEEVAPAPPPAPEPVAVPEAATPAPAPTRQRRWFSLRRGQRRRYEADTSESTRLLQQVAASTDEVFGARRATEARSELLVLLQAQRDRAEEDVRVAERSWHDLAGDDAVEDVDAVVRRFDPQHQAARELAEDTVGARAAATLLARATGRWDEEWLALGVEATPPADETWVDQLAERMARAIVLVDEAAARQEDLLAAAPAAPVVRVEEPAS